MITPRATFIKELVDPEHQLFHHRIQSCSYNLDRHHLTKVLIDNMIHHRWYRYIRKSNWYLGKSICNGERFRT